jgi:hypothetical protein
LQSVEEKKVYFVSCILRIRNETVTSHSNCISFPVCACEGERLGKNSSTAENLLAMNYEYKVHIFGVYQEQR